MSTAEVKAVGEQIAEALRTVPDLRVVVGLGRPIAPPVAVVGPPRLEWGPGFCEAPTAARWLVYLVVPLSEFATGQLMELVGPVVTALNGYTEGVVTTATPGIYPGSGERADLPAYEIALEWS